MTDSDLIAIRCAEIHAAAARALIQAMGMHAENMQRALRGESMAYDDKAFFKLIDEECIGHNAVVAATRL